MFLLKKLVNSSDDKRIQSIDLIGTNACETSRDIVREEEEIKYNNVIKGYKK